MRVTGIHIQAISAAIGFVEQNLKRDITVTDMADAAGYSLYHFSRVFNRVAHHTPYDYLMRRRLSAAARDLMESKRRITDIAVDYCFNNLETFSRAFKHLFATPASQWRKAEQPDSQRLMPRLSQAHLRHRCQGGLTKPAVVQRASLELVGLMTLIKQERAGIDELWRMLVAETAEAESADAYGLVTFPENRQNTGYFYLAAVRTQSLSAPHPSLVSKQIPAGEFVSVTHHGPPAELYLTLDYIHHTWLPKSGRDLKHSLILEAYGRSPIPHSDSIIEILIPLA